MNYITAVSKVTGVKEDVLLNRKPIVTRKDREARGILFFYMSTEWGLNHMQIARMFGLLHNDVYRRIKFATDMVAVKDPLTIMWMTQVLQVMEKPSRYDKVCKRAQESSSKVSRIVLSREGKAFLRLKEMT